MLKWMLWPKQKLRRSCDVLKGKSALVAGDWLGGWRVEHVAPPM
jgi:hypothetical protein